MIFFCLRALLAMGMLSLMAACSILPQNDPVAAYRLPSATAPQSIADNTSSPVGTSERSLRIVTPNSSRILESDRILVMPKDNLLQSYSGVRWVDPVPILLRNRLLRAFREDGQLRALSSDDDSVLAVQELGGELTSFQSEYRNGMPTVIIEFNARLIDTASRRVIATRTFRVEQVAQDIQVGQVIVAFGQASDALAAQIIEWVMSQPVTRSTGK